MQQRAGTVPLRLPVPQTVPGAICKTLPSGKRRLNNPAPARPIPGIPAEIRTILLPTGRRAQVPPPGPVLTEIPAAGTILLRGKVIHQHTASQGPPISPAIIAALPPGAVVH